jgi:hypothetical protein
MSEMTIPEMAKKVLETVGHPMTSSEIWNEAVAMKIAKETTYEHPPALVNSALNASVKKHGKDSPFIKVSVDPNKYFLNNGSISPPTREGVPSLSDAPTGKKILNLLERIDIARLRIENERELELVMWGALCSRWPDWIKWRQNFGGRTCDVGLDCVAVEMKYIKTLGDKDRLVGQVLDYLKDVDEVVVVAVDKGGLLKNSPLYEFENVTVVII